MPLICLETFIAAPLQIVFDLSRSVDVHKESMTHHAEEIIDGIAKGLMKEGDTVTWRARHLFKSRTLKVKITAMNAPHSFTDEMMAGDFKKMKHVHLFKITNNGTLMVDQFYFESPFGVIGKVVNALFLTAYMKRLLLYRNNEMKRMAETAGTQF